MDTYELKMKLLSQLISLLNLSEFDREAWELVDTLEQFIEAKIKEDKN